LYSIKPNQCSAARQPIREQQVERQPISV